MSEIFDGDTTPRQSTEVSARPGEGNVAQQALTVPGRAEPLSVTVSATRMAMLSRCGIQFERRYIRGEILPPGVALIVGGAVDRSVTANMRHKLSGDGLLPTEAVADIARDECAQRWQSGDILLTDEEAELGPAKVKGEAVDKSVRLAELHAKELAPVIEPTHVQRGFELDLSGAGYPATVVGYLDLQEGRERIRDTKTSKRSPAADAADSSLQLGLYALAAKVLDGEIPEAVQLDYLVDLKTPKVMSLPSRRDDVSLMPVLARIERFIATVQAGRFPPADPDSWQCSHQFCGYWTTCAYAMRPVSVAVKQMSNEAALRASLDAMAKTGVATLNGGM